jgi:MarR family transcriptional regulator, lower aerobic nicotinate degradation pathway regulator
MKASKRRLPADTFDLQHTVGHLVRRTHQLHNLLFSQVTAGCDITSPQFAALRTIEAFPELEQNGLSEIIAYDRTTIGGLIDRLEAKGLVQRSVGEHDRRTKLLTLTRAGSALLKEVSPKVRSIQSRLLAPLSAGERKEFLALLERIVDLEEEIDDA